MKDRLLRVVRRVGRMKRPVRDTSGKALCRTWSLSLILSRKRIVTEHFFDHPNLANNFLGMSNRTRGDETAFVCDWDDAHRLMTFPRKVGRNTLKWIVIMHYTLAPTLYLWKMVVKDEERKIVWMPVSRRSQSVKTKSHGNYFQLVIDDNNTTNNNLI